MKIYVFSDTAKTGKTVYSDTIKTIQHVSQETNVADLVVAAYYYNTNWNGGLAIVRQWQTRHTFTTGRGRWNLTANFGVPSDLPEKFKLIRLLLPAGLKSYPKKEIDIYHWQHFFARWQDHLAHLYAHELHHFRRYHLGLHPREGEQSANKWAIEQMQRLGFNVTSQKLTIKKKAKKSSKQPELGMVLNPLDFGYSTIDKITLAKLSLTLSTKIKNQYIQDKLAHCENLRKLAPGDSLKVTFDPSDRYTQQQASIVRIMKKNSLRIIIRTKDGKEWRWPMVWLST